MVLELVHPYSINASHVRQGHNPKDLNSISYYGYCAENDIYCGLNPPNGSASQLASASEATGNGNSSQETFETSSKPFHENYFRNTGVINLVRTLKSSNLLVEVHS